MFIYFIYLEARDVDGCCGVLEAQMSDFSGKPICWFTFPQILQHPRVDQAEARNPELNKCRVPSRVAGWQGSNDLTPSPGAFP